MGKLADNRKLYDIAIRLQLFVECVKVWQARQFDKVLLEVNDELRKLLGRVNYKTLDGLTKRELTKLVLEVKQMQSRLYSRFTADFLKQMQDFVNATAHVNRIIYASAFVDEDEEDVDVLELTDSEAMKVIEKENDSSGFPFLLGLAALKPSGKQRLWASIKNQPIAANGTFLESFIKAQLGSASVAAENRIRKGVANKSTPQAVAIEGTKDIARISAQGSAVSATIMQHILSMVSESFTSGLFGRYEWISVIDSGTTDICRSRNHKIYEYGRGPVPPAHIRCRSSIVPYRGKGSPKETFGAWLGRQSSRIQDVALGTATGKRFREGKIKAADLNKVANPPAMSAEELKESVSIILTGK